MNEPVITIIGNLADDPELRFTQSGVAVAKLRMAMTPRDKNAAGEWVDGEPFWQDVTCWREMAENVAETLHKGDRVVVFGRMKQRQWEDKEGGKRRSTDLEADAIGPDLFRATAVVTRKSKGGGTAARGDDQWAGASKQRPAAVQQQAQQGPPANAEQQRAAQQAAPAGSSAAASPW